MIDHDDSSFEIISPVRCCDSCHAMIQIQRMGTQALLQLPMKKLKYYLTAYQLPTKGALEKQDLVKIIVQSHPISNSSEIHFRNFKAKERKAIHQDTSETDSQSDSGGTFSGFVNGLVDGIGDIFKDDDEPARREEEERRRRQKYQQRQESSRRQQQQQQQQRQQQQQQQQQYQQQQQQQQQQHWRQQQQRQWQQRQQQQYQQQQQQNQNTQGPQTNQSSTTTNSAQTQNRPQTATTSPPPRSSPANSSPDLVEPPSLDTLLQANIDPGTLSVRTLKAILKGNFVEHSNVLEKSELVTRVGRLLEDRKQERQRTDDRDLEDEGLCRICCDASQNCVFLVRQLGL